MNNAQNNEYENKIINQLIEDVNNSFKKKLLGNKEIPIYFEALQLDAKIKNNIIYRDLGYIEKLAMFAKKLDKHFGNPEADLPDIVFGDSENIFGTECKLCGFQKDDQKRMLVTIFYRYPKGNNENDRFIKAYLKGFAEATAVFNCPPAFDYLEKAFKKQFKEIKESLEDLCEGDVNKLAYWGAIRAVGLLNYSPEQIIEKVELLFGK